MSDKRATCLHRSISCREERHPICAKHASTGLGLTVFLYNYRKFGNLLSEVRIDSISATIPPLQAEPSRDKFQTVVFLHTKACDEGNTGFDLHFGDALHCRESTAAKLFESDHKV